MSPQESIRQSPVITEEEMSCWEHVFSLGQRMSWQPRSIVIGSESPLGLHFIIDGLFQTLAYSRQGQKRTLWNVGQRNILGEIGLFTNLRPIYQMECVRKGTTIFFSKELMISTIIPQNPCISISLMRILALKLRNQSEDSQEWNFMPVLIRVGKILFTMFEQEGPELEITHRELAEFLGIHRVSVTNALSCLADDHIIEGSRNKIHIINPQKLKQIINQ